MDEMTESKSGDVVDEKLDQLKAALSDRYAIEREIGQGGMATVYLASDLKHHRQVAVLGRAFFRTGSVRWYRAEQ